MKEIIILFICHFFALTIYGQGQILYINEIMSSNVDFLYDEDGDDSDWIELYNKSSATIHLDGYYLSDKADDLNLWALPDTVLFPNQFLIIFASDKNRNGVGNELHANFKISSSGETIYLSHNDMLSHTVTIPALSTNKSYGLGQDGQLPFMVFNNPTPSTTNNTSQGLGQLTISHLGGIYNQVFPLTITGNDIATTIHYTTDGTIPTIDDLTYTTPLNLNTTLQSQANINQIQISRDDLHQPPAISDVLKSIVIRAAAFNTQGKRVTEITTNSYFIKALGIDHGTLPIVSISAEYEDLFNFERGILVPGIHFNSNHSFSGNFSESGIAWEKPIYVEFYESGTNEGFRQAAGVRTHGGSSRVYPQKGLRLYARSDYGKSHFSYPLFSDKPLDDFKRLVLKPFSSSWSQSGIEEYIASKIVIDLDIDRIATRPVILYLNGEYWGIYNLQERIDEDYLEDNYQIDEDSVNLIANWKGGAEIGSGADFRALYDFINSHDLSIQSNYNTVEDWIDMDNFIDYMLFEIFIGNYDWPDNNMECWQPKNGKGKWRWLFFDADAGFRKVNFNGFAHALDTLNEGWPTNAKSTLFLRKLLENEVFNNKFFNRLEILLGNQLNYQKTLPYYQEIIQQLNAEIDNQIRRFSKPSSYDKWIEKVIKINNFLHTRSCTIQMQVLTNFNKVLDIDACVVNALKINEISVFPNPNQGNFTLSFHADQVNLGILMITTTLGQVITFKPQFILKGDNIIEFNNSNLPNGVLFLTIQTESTTLKTKIIHLE